jgi:hypothetical protein
VWRWFVAQAAAADVAVETLLLAVDVEVEFVLVSDEFKFIVSHVTCHFQMRDAYTYYHPMFSPFIHLL